MFMGSWVIEEARQKDFEAQLRKPEMLLKRYNLMKSQTQARLQVEQDSNRIESYQRFLETINLQILDVQQRMQHEIKRETV
jgi:hypothetical protein